MAHAVKRDGFVKQGDLSFKPKGQLIKKLKKHQACLFQQSECGVARLEIYESEKDRKSGSYCMLIPGSEVVLVGEHLKPQSSDEKNGFVIATKEQQHVFYTNSKQEQSDWLQKTRDTLLQPYVNTNMQATKNISRGVTEENDIYEPADEFLREYRVVPGHETRTVVGLNEEVRMVVENGHITIITLKGNRAGRWGIEHLRRFGYNDNDFHFEAGRKSEYGEGVFSFVTKQGKQIHALVAKEKMQARKSKEIEASRRDLLNPGQIQLSIDDDDIPLTMGNHIYEEITIKKRPTEKKTAPEKPARQNFNKSQQSVEASEEPVYENTELKSPPAHMHASGKGSFNSVKSQPTRSALGPAKVPYQPAKEALKTFTNYPNPTKPGNVTYSEPVHHTEAWKTHGIADSPTEECEYNPNVTSQSSSSDLVRDGACSVESQYATLDFTTSKNIFPNPKASKKCVYTQLAQNTLLDEMSEKMQTGNTRNMTEEKILNEPIYAEVCKPKKKPAAQECEKSHL